MKYTLRNYQLEGIDKIREKKNFGLFWQQRLGKTIVSLSAVKDYQKVIIAVPNSVITYWYKEIKENFEEENINVKILPICKKRRFQLYEEFQKTKQMWIIGSYNTLSLDAIEKQDILKGADYLVLDESHFLRNRKSKRSKGILKLRENCQYCLALSGTPAVNSAIDLLRIFRLIYNDKKFANKYYFKKKYFEVSKKNNRTFYHLKDNMIDEWNTMLSELCDIKKIHDYLQWLPKSIEKNVYLEMNNDQANHYKKMLVESKRIIKDHEKTEHGAITQIMRLRQICLDPRLLDINATSIKLEWLLDYIENIFASNDNERIIVFTNFTSLFKKWNLKISPDIKFDFLIGEQPLKERNKIIEDFQNGKTHVLFANIQVSSLGITLDRATISIFLEKSWDPVNNEQAAFRMLDVKQKEKNEPKLLINLICNNTIDEHIQNVLSRKRNRTNLIYELKKYILEN